MPKRLFDYFYGSGDKEAEINGQNALIIKILTSLKSINFPIINNANTVSYEYLESNLLESSVTQELKEMIAIAKLIGLEFSRKEVKDAKAKFDSLQLKTRDFERDAKYFEAESNYDKLTKKGMDLSEVLRSKLLNFLLTQIESIIHIQDERALTKQEESFLKSLIELTDPSESSSQSLSKEYQKMIDIAQYQNTTSDQKINIINQVKNCFQYFSTNEHHIIPNVILDIYKVALGPVSNIKSIDKVTLHILEAAGSLAAANRGNAFEMANQEILKQLNDYKIKIEEYSKKNNGSYQDNNLEDVLIELKGIEYWYSEYFHPETFDTIGKEYFEWLAIELLKFNKEMINISKIMSSNINKKYILSLIKLISDITGNVVYKRERYPHNYDFVTEGRIGPLLYQLHEILVSNNYKIEDDSAKNLSITFMEMVIKKLPKALLERIKTLYQHDNNFSTYLNNTHSTY